MWTENQVKGYVNNWTHKPYSYPGKSPKANTGRIWTMSNEKMECYACQCSLFVLSLNLRNLLSRINAISASFCCLRTERELTSEWTFSKQTHQGNYKYVLPYFLLVMVSCFSTCILDKFKVTRVSLCISVMLPWLIIH